MVPRIVTACICPRANALESRLTAALALRESAFAEMDGMTVEAIRRKFGVEAALGVSIRRVDAENGLTCALLALLRDATSLALLRGRCKLLDLAVRDALAAHHRRDSLQRWAVADDDMGGVVEYVSGRLRFALRAGDGDGLRWALH